MTTRKNEFAKLDNKLSLIRSRLTALYRDRDEIGGELQQKGLTPDMRGILESRLATVNDRIKVEEKEEWDADDERDDALYYPGR